MAERVTVEHNGERITLEVPDGTTDEQIQQYLAQPQAKPTFGQQLSKEVSSITDKPTAMAKATGVTDVLNRGVVAGALGGPVDLFNMGLQGTDWLANKITGAVRPEALPYLPKLATEKPIGGSEWFGQQLQNVGAVTPERRPILEAGTGMVSGLVAPVRTATGAIRPLGYEAGAQMIDAGKDLVQAVKPVVTAPINSVGQTARGMVKGATGTGDALIPMGETYIPVDIINKVKAGELSFAEAQKFAKPISELPSNPVERAALAVAGKQFPVEGRGLEAFGQRLGQTYEEKPWKLAVDIGIPAMTGIPVSPFTMGKGLQAGADWLLSRKGFSPMSEIEALRKAKPAPTGQQSFNFSEPVAPVAPEFATAPKIEIKGVGQTPVKPDVMEMVAPETPGAATVYPNKEAFEKGTLFDRTAGKPIKGAYREGDTIVHVEDRPGTQLPPGLLANDPLRRATIEQGRTVTYKTDLQGRPLDINDPNVPLELKTQEVLRRAEEMKTKSTAPVKPDVMEMVVPEEPYLPSKEIIQDPVMRGLYEKQTKNGTEITYTDGNKKITEINSPDETVSKKIEWTNGKEWNGSRIHFEEPGDYSPTTVTQFTREGGPKGKDIKDSIYYYNPAEETKELTIVDHKKGETIKIQWEKDWDTEEWSAYATKNGVEDPKLSKKYTTTEPEDLFPEIKAYWLKD